MKSASIHISKLISRIRLCLCLAFDNETSFEPQPLLIVAVNAN